jgi:hypothetical protein
MHRLTAPPTPGQPARPGRSARQSRVSWLGALPPLARPVIRTMPWVMLISGCLASLAYLAVLAHFAHAPRPPLDPEAVRLAFLPAVAALAFVPRTPFRPLAQATPVPAWVAPAGHLLLAAPILAATCWAQLGIIASTVPAHTPGPLPPDYPLIAQLTGWCAVTVATAAWAGRSRYADLSGAIAAPASLAAVALAWYAPITSRFVAEPAATPHCVTIVWYAVTAAALVLTGVAMRDQWHRYSRRPLPVQEKSLSGRSGQAEPRKSSPRLR